MKNNKVEVNGPANVIMLVGMMLARGEITETDHDFIVAEMQYTMIYLKLLDNPNDVAWHDVKRIADED